MQQVRIGLPGSTLGGMCLMSPNLTLSSSIHGLEINSAGEGRALWRGLCWVLLSRPTQDAFLCRSCLCVIAMQGLITQPSDKAAPPSECPCCFPGISRGLQALHTLDFPSFPGHGGKQPSQKLGRMSPIYLGTGSLEERQQGGEKGPRDATQGPLQVRTRSHVPLWEEAWFRGKCQAALAQGFGSASWAGT